MAAEASGDRDRGDVAATPSLSESLAETEESTKIIALNFTDMARSATREMRLRLRALRDVTDYLVVGGGGMRTLAVVGCLQALFENNDDLAHVFYRTQLRGVAGTSMGSFVALCLALHMGPMEMGRLMRRLQLGRILANINPIRLATHLGLQDGTEVYRVADMILASRVGRSDVTFEDLYAVTGTQLVIVAVDICDNRTVLMSHKHTPALRVREALRRSTALPILFDPVPVTTPEGVLHYQVDGGIHRNVPIDVFGAPSRTLAFKVKFKPAMPVARPGAHTISDLFGLTSMLIGCVLEKQVQDLHAASPCSVVEVNPDVSIASFDLTERQWAALEAQGRAAMELFALPDWTVGAVTLALARAHEHTVRPPEPFMTRPMPLPDAPRSRSEAAIDLAFERMAAQFASMRHLIPDDARLIAASTAVAPPGREAEEGVESKREDRRNKLSSSSSSSNGTISRGHEPASSSVAVVTVDPRSVLRTLPAVAATST